MRTFLDCIPCFVRQALDAARLATDDEAVHEQVLGEALRMASAWDSQLTPPVMGQGLHRLIRGLTGSDDPYRAIKQRFNAFALHMYPRLRRRVESADDPFATAARLAIAGNVIDSGLDHRLDEATVEAAIQHALSAPLHGDPAALQTAVGQARDILYLADNAGEIVFDRLLVEQMPPGSVTVAVRGRPVLNDATMEDAEAAGLTGRVRVTDNGSDAPGTLVEDCSEAFRRIFERADLVVAKGQGNYETLSDVDKNTFFVLKAKCPVIARHIGCRVGDLVIQEKPPLLPGRQA